jgi:hypothetical protein
VTEVRAERRPGRVGTWLAGGALVAALATAMAPLATSWTIAGHSALIELVRAQAIHLAVEGGDLWPTWLPDLYGRHGSPLPLFYAPLSYVPVELARAAGASATGAIHLGFALGWLAGAAGAGWSARSWFGSGAGLAAAAAYGLAPYLVADVYARAGLAEVAALAIAPWALGAIGRTGFGAVAGGALAVGALVVAHNIAALLIVPLLVLAAATTPAPLRRRALAALGLGLLLSAWFWLPALASRDEVFAEESLTSGHFDFRGHFLPVAGLLPFGEAVSFSRPAGPRLVVGVGEVLWLGLLGSVALLRGSGRPERSRLLLLSASAFAALAMTTGWSRPLWELLPLVRFVQFPFRWLMVATLCSALLVGALVARLPVRWRAFAAAAVAALSLLVAKPLFSSPIYAQFERDSFRLVFATRPGLPALADPERFVHPEAKLDRDGLIAIQATGTSSDDFLPRHVTAKVPPVSRAAEPLGPGLEVTGADWGYPEVRASVRVFEPAALALHQFDFPGWRVEVDGQRRAHRTEPGRGRIVVDLAPGDREVVARFGWTPLRAWASALSAATALALAAGLVLAPRRRAAAASGPPGTAAPGC